MEKTEYFVYCGFFIMHLWIERFVQMPKGEYLEVPFTLQSPDPLLEPHQVQHPLPGDLRIIWGNSSLVFYHTTLAVTA